MLSGSSVLKTVVLDSSVLFAILLEEAGYERYVKVLNEAKDLYIGAPTLAEAGIVIQSRQGSDGVSRLLQLLQRWEVRTLEFTNVHAMEAVDAYQRFGKGRHPASLNMGDCNSYATTKVAGGVLLYQGNDFAQTDLMPLAL